MDAMIRIFDKNMMDNCPADRSSINNAVHIFGSLTSKLQGKFTRSAQDHIILGRIPPIPPIIFPGIKM